MVLLNEISARVFLIHLFFHAGFYCNKALLGLHSFINTISTFLILYNLIFKKKTVQRILFELLMSHSGRFVCFGKLRNYIHIQNKNSE